MSNGPKIHVDLKKTAYTDGGSIATGILLAISRLKDAANTISSISLTDTEVETERFGYGLRFEIVIKQIPDLIANEIVVTEDYFGPQSDTTIATFIESRWKDAFYYEINRLKNVITRLESITYLGVR